MKILAKTAFVLELDADELRGLYIICAKQGSKKAREYVDEFSTIMLNSGVALPHIQQEDAKKEE